ncbi:RimK/LysX family protein [Spongiibacter taiwanensis]|uniref:ATP-dependent zinc protease family protein n=1 Tax=Spongiibacter taiwanensis TaxID=1748242 RepID=UPI002034BB43|nr:RimK/LysX family protein [Spongiibacter taiwanensis]USA41734.1 RimK/LysX family protein [Spongiibacter taiwanensis]
MRVPAITIGCLLLFAGEALANNNRIFGLSEQVYIKDFDVTFDAKVDTGAESVSVNAINIRVEKGRGDDEEDMVHFDLVMPDNSLKSMSHALKKHIRIKRRASDYDDDEKDYARRPVLELDLCIGGEHRKVEANLADRRQFSKPVLIGHEPLVDFKALVDPSAANLQSIELCKAPVEDTGAKDNEE